MLLAQMQLDQHAQRRQPQTRTQRAADHYQEVGRTDWHLNLCETLKIPTGYQHYPGHRPINSLRLHGHIISQSTDPKTLPSTNLPRSGLGHSLVKQRYESSATTTEQQIAPAGIGKQATETRSQLCGLAASLWIFPMDLRRLTVDCSALLAPSLPDEPQTGSVMWR